MRGLLTNIALIALTGSGFALVTQAPKPTVMDCCKLRKYNTRCATVHRVTVGGIQIPDCAQNEHRHPTPPYRSLLWQVETNTKKPLLLLCDAVFTTSCNFYKHAANDTPYITVRPSIGNTDNSAADPQPRNSRSVAQDG